MCFRDNLASRWRPRWNTSHRCNIYTDSETYRDSTGTHQVKFRFVALCNSHRRWIEPVHHQWTLPIFKWHAPSYQLLVLISRMFCLWETLQAFSLQKKSSEHQPFWVHLGCPQLLWLHCQLWFQPMHRDLQTAPFSSEVDSNHDHPQSSPREHHLQLRFCLRSTMQAYSELVAVPQIYCPEFSQALHSRFELLRSERIVFQVFPRTSFDRLSKEACWCYTIWALLEYAFAADEVWVHLYSSVSISDCRIAYDSQTQNSVIAWWLPYLCIQGTCRMSQVNECGLHACSDV